MVLISAKSISIATSLGLGLSLVSATAEAAVLGKYTFEGETLAPSEVTGGVTFSNFSYSGDGTLSFPSGNAPTAQDSISANRWLTDGDFFEFSVAAGTALITSLDLELRRSPTGPQKVSAFFSLDDFASRTLLDEIFPTENTFSNFNIDFGPGFTGNVAFRFFGDDATNNSGTLRIDNVTINGEPAAVPTPALLPGLIGFGLSLARKRKGQAAASF